MSPTPPADMHPQLMLLMELQDMRAQHRELAEGAASSLGEKEAEHFHIDPADARVQLETKIHELEDQLTSSIRARYERIIPQRDRVVVPVIGGVCYGCFVSIPTATAGNRNVHGDLRSCQSCGCFIYVLS